MTYLVIFFFLTRHFSNDAFVYRFPNVLKKKIARELPEEAFAESIKKEAPLSSPKKKRKTPTKNLQYQMMEDFNKIKRQQNQIFQYSPLCETLKAQRESIQRQRLLQRTLMKRALEESATAHNKIQIKDQYNNWKAVKEDDGNFTFPDSQESIFKEIYETEAFLQIEEGRMKQTNKEIEQNMKNVIDLL